MLTRVRKALPAPAKRIGRKLLSLAREASVRLFSRNAALASVYYCFFSRRFDREHLAVLRGRAAYSRNSGVMAKTSPLLRRNIHRLEKGLIMRPRRRVFALDYLEETVQAYQLAVAQSSHSREELKWAKDVLDEYFVVVGEAPEVRQARFRYQDANKVWHRPDEGKISFKPYPQEKLLEPSISFDELHGLYKRRRSVRWYRHLPVEDVLINQLIDAASLAPSACNRQPFRFVVATDQEKAVAIANCAGGTGGYAHQIPAIIVVVGDLSAYPMERDRHLIYIDASLAAMQLMLAAETIGLSTCSINWPDVDSSERKIQKIIDLAPYERVIMLISIGYPDESGGIPFSQKKASDLLVTKVMAAK